MRDPTEYDLALADMVNEIAPDVSAISTDGPQPEHVRRAMIARAARIQRQAYEQARLCLAAVPASEQRTRFYQPFEGAVILRDEEPYFGGFYAAGVYLADYETAKRAQRALIERDHLEALRRNDWLDRQRICFAITGAGLLALEERDELQRAR